MDDSVIDSTHEVAIRPHVTQSHASTLTSTPVIASGSRVTLDARHYRKRIFLSDSDSENDSSTICVKPQGMCPPIPTIHEPNGSQGE
jgi:hypothetical protein